MRSVWRVAALMSISCTLAGPAAADAVTSSPISELPLIELPGTGQDPRLVVIWSGDGGWQDLDKVIGEKLASQGIAVIGVNTLRYFWSKKPPEQVAADLGTIIDHYSQAWGRPEVVLVGYSFGADILPFAFNRLPEVSRARVKQLSLLALSTFADFEIHVSGWLTDGRHPDSVDTAPELDRLSGITVQCFYGEEDKGTGCTLPQLKGAQVIRTSGGHHFDGDYDALARKILAGTS